MRLYHILPSEFAVSNLALRRLKISRVHDLNDPFELLSYKFQNEDHRKAWEATKQKLMERKGMLCFSKGWKNPVLWSHYGDRHKGVCLGFDIPDEAPGEIDYLPERLDLNEISLKTGKSFVFSKFKHWEYENEWRTYVDIDPSTEENGLYFMEFGEDLKLKEVILGVRCTLPIENLKTLLKGIGSGISLVKTKLDDQSFQLVIDQSSVWTT